jgi:hypothetical protein
MARSVMRLEKTMLGHVKGGFDRFHGFVPVARFLLNSLSITWLTADRAQQLRASSSLRNASPLRSSPSSHRL